MFIDASHQTGFDKIFFIMGVLTKGCRTKLAIGSLSAM